MCRSDHPTQSRIVATTAETCRVKSASSLTWIKAEHSKLIQMAPMTNRASFDSFARSTFGIEPGSPIGARLESLATRMELPKGDSADLEKDADQIVFIGRGATKLVLHASNDREQIVAFHFVGDIVSVPAERHFVPEPCWLVWFRPRAADLVDEEAADGEGVVPDKFTLEPEPGSSC